MSQRNVLKSLTLLQILDQVIPSHLVQMDKIEKDFRYRRANKSQS